MVLPRGAVSWEVHDNQVTCGLRRRRSTDCYKNTVETIKQRVGAIVYTIEREREGEREREEQTDRQTYEAQLCRSVGAWNCHVIDLLIDQPATTRA